MDHAADTSEISVIIPVGWRHGVAARVHAEYKAGLAELGRPYQLIYVLDGPQPEFEQGLRQLHRNGENLTVISLSRYFGEATAIMAGFDKATDRPSSRCRVSAVKGSEIGKLVASSKATT